MKKREYSAAFIVSLLMHGSLVAMLLWGTDFIMTKPKPSGNIVQAVVVDPALVNQQAQRIRQQREAARKKLQSRTG